MQSQMRRLEDDVGLHPFDDFVKPHEGCRALAADHIGNHLGTWAATNAFQRIWFDPQLDDRSVGWI